MLYSSAVLLASITIGSVGEGPHLAHQQKLLQHEVGWKAIEIRVHTDRKTSDWIMMPREYPLVSRDEHYIETSDGARYYQSIVRSTRPNSRLCDTYCCDRLRCYTIQERDYNPPSAGSRVVTITRDFGNEIVSSLVVKPEPLRYLHVGKTPLHDALLKGIYGGEAKVGKWACDVFVLSGEAFGTRVYRYWLDKGTSIPLRVRIYQNSDDFVADRASTHWEAEKLQSIDGQPFPTQSRLVWSNWNRKSGRFEQGFTERIEVESLKYDQSYDPSRFKPEIGPHTTVRNLITGKTTHGIPDAAALEVETSGSVQEDPGGALAWAPLIGGILGIGVLLIGIAIAIRRRFVQ